MIGHLVKRVKLNGLTKINHKIWEPKIDGIIYKSYKDIPCDKCEICGIARLANQHLYDKSRRMYYHHIFPRNKFGNINDVNTTRNKFVVCCGLCHGLIHRMIKRNKCESPDDYYNAVRDAYRYYRINKRR